MNELSLPWNNTKYNNYEHVVVRETRNPLHQLVIKLYQLTFHIYSRRPNLTN